MFAAVLLCLLLVFQPYPLIAFHYHHGGKIEWPLDWFVQTTVQYSIIYATSIAIVSTPIWWLIGKARAQGAYAAAGLGFALTFAAYFFTFGGARLQMEDIRDAAIFGALGAITGLIVLGTAKIQSNLTQQMPKA